MSETVNETTIGGVRIYSRKNVRQTLNSKLNNAFVNKQYNIMKCFRTLLSFKRLKISLLLREKFKWTICLSTTTKRSKVTRYGPRLTLLTAQSPFLPGNLPDEMVGAKPHSRLLRLRSKEQTSAGSGSWDKGGGRGGGNPDPEIRGLPDLRFFFFFSALRASVWSWVPGLV